MAMCYYIGIEDLAANALIALLQSKKKEKFVSYKELENYGQKVVQVLNKKGEKAILILSRDSTNALFRNYSDLFIESEEKDGIKLIEGITEEELIEKFRGYLSWDVLLAFVDKESLQELGVA